MIYVAAESMRFFIAVMADVISTLDVYQFIVFRPSWCRERRTDVAGGRHAVIGKKRILDFVGVSPGAKAS